MILTSLDESLLFQVSWVHPSVFGAKNTFYGIAMLLKKWLDILMGAWGKERSWRFKGVAMLLGATVFFAVVPALLFLAAWLLDKPSFRCGRDLWNWGCPS